MICQECNKRPATLHFTKIVNGVKTEFHICETCAREKGELIPGAPNGFSIHNLLTGLLDLGLSGAAQQSQSLRCDSCGLSYAEFSKNGRFGCSHCYTQFDDRLGPLFKRVHGSTLHTGKVPKRTGKMIQTKREILLLKQQMAFQIQQEEFEQAAQLRDQIRHLEKSLETS